MAVIKKFRIKSFKNNIPIIEFNNVSLSYGNRLILDKLNFKINEGQIFGMLGPNGVGKSTIFNLITGLINPKHGKIKINGEDVVLNENINEKKTSNIIINENFQNKVVDNNEDGSKILLEPNTLKDISISNETSAIANERSPKEEMVLKSSGNSWVEIEDLDGNSYLTRLMRSGETFVVPDKKGLTLSTGNAGVLSLTFGSIHISNFGSIGEVISSRPLNIEAFKKR